MEGNAIVSGSIRKKPSRSAPLRCDADRPTVPHTRTDLGRGGGAEDHRVAALHGLREAGGVHGVPDHHLVLRGARRLLQLPRGLGAAHEAHGLELCMHL